jgi:adenylate kinase
VRVVMIGPPGAGKGTQAKLLREKFAVCHVSTGDMLREADRAGTRLGLEARKHMSRGMLVPDDVVIGIVEERLAKPDCDPGFVLDGFPRTVHQAEELDALLRTRAQPLTAVIVVNVPREELVRRLSGRLVCRGCGTLFHVVFDPPKQAGRCDRCDGELYQREDDREDAIRRRLEVYEREIEPVLAHYAGRGLLRHVDGVGTRDQVFGRVAESAR